MSDRTRGVNFNGGITDISSLLKHSISVFFFALSGIAGAQVPKEIFHPPEFLNTDNSIAQSGYFQLEWKSSVSSKDLQYELQQGTSPDFTSPKTIYLGSETASFVSGIPDGDYYFRIRKIRAGHTGEWSDTLTIHVKHHSLSLAWLFFSLGGTVFLATTGLVIHGSIKSGKNE